MWQTCKILPNEKRRLQNIRGSVIREIPLFSPKLDFVDWSCRASFRSWDWKRRPAKVWLCLMDMWQRSLPLERNLQCIKEKRRLSPWNNAGKCYFSLISNKEIVSKLYFSQSRASFRASCWPMALYATKIHTWLSWGPLHRVFQLKGLFYVKTLSLPDLCEFALKKHGN